MRRLLRAHAAAGVLDRPSADAHAWQPVCLAGRRVGDWTLERELGRGGMSVVWLARRGEDATLQRAAIKLLPVGALTHPALVRFRREQAILARLNHPHIAHLYEAGAADDGTPYLAMEQVEGERIDHWCDRREFDLRARVQLMLDVCAAIAYAHRNLVVHADLKPSNVLVDAEGHVRVLDFGIGRLLDDRLSEATRTVWRAVTPEYAAPEQLAGEPVNTAADVFGLGALLYRLLTGQGPREHDCGAECLAPSRAVRNAQGSRDARTRLLRGDLDTIVLRALCSEPERRYASIEALSVDLRAWLDERPIAARAPSRRYRARKFIRRNRLAVVASLAVAAALLIGFATTIWQARRAHVQAVAAKQQAQRAVAVKEVLVTLLERTDPGRVAGDPPASVLLRMGSRSIRDDRSLAPATRAELLRVIGFSQRARGKYEDAQETLDAALRLYARGAVHDPVGYADTLDVRSWVAYERDHSRQALEMLRHADALLGGIRGPLTPLHAHIRTGLAEQLAESGHPAEASVMARDVVQRLRVHWRQHRHAYGYALRVLGTAADIDHRPLDAVRWLEQARRAYEPVKDAPDLANTDNELGLARWDAGQFEGAEHDFEAAVRAYTAIFGATNPTTLTVRSNAAEVLVEQGRARQAIGALQDILRETKRAYGDKPGHNVALTDYWLALAYYRSGQTRQALAPAREARRIGMDIGNGFLGRHDTMSPFVGLLQFELLQGDADAALLQQGVVDCNAPDAPTALRRWICIARALRASDRGRCRVPDIESMQRPPVDDVDRRWWLAYQLLRARCGAADVRADARRAVVSLEHGSSAPLPAWLRTRLVALKRHR
ncbi:protein kinase domain-containing protein [Oleiagrimonas soli]|uniref:Serine/threonine-protein kinase n=1 Tax=Oleiagrimonas soli TaxID=1543381 RepID=A0A841KMR9_9GAMM|nr:serine/threonine-protein kinase [Oleiagrimonas soli]